MEESKEVKEINAAISQLENKRRKLYKTHHTRYIRLENAIKSLKRIRSTVMLFVRRYGSEEARVKKMVDDSNKLIKETKK